MEVVVDQSECIGCGNCASIAPNTFRLNDDGKSEVFKQNGDPRETIQEAIDNCPVECISWK